MRVYRLPGWLCVAGWLVLAGGCATLNEGQCVAGDWYEIGKRDGAAGWQRARLFKHVEACSKYAAQPDPYAYDAGREAGLTLYCTPYQGFIEGNEGHPYRGVCAADVEQSFLATWRDGRAIYEAREAVDDVERKIHALQGKFEDEKTSDKERKRLRRQLRELGQTRNQREAHLRRMQYLHRPPVGGYR